MANEFRVKNGLIVGSLSVDSGGTLTIPDDIVHDGDTNNKISFGTDTQSFQTGGTARFNISDSGLQIGSGARVTTINTSFSDNDTSLMTSQAIKEKIENYGYTTNTGDITGVDLTGGTGVTIGSETGTTSGNYSSTISIGQAVGTSDDVTFSTVTIASDLIHSGDTNTKLGFGTDTITLTTGGTARLTLTDSAATINQAATFSGGIANAGTISAGTWSGTTIGVSKGGTGITSYSNGELLIGNSLGVLTAATLTAGDGIDVTNGNGAVTIAAEAASATNPGVVELATTAETTTGTDTTRAVTPDGLKDGYQGSTNVTTLGTISTGTWQGTAIDLANYVTGVLPSANLDADTAHLSGTQTFSGDKTFSGTVTIASDLIHSGDTNNKFTFGTDTQTFTTGGSSRADISDSGFRLGGSGARVTTINTGFVDNDTSLMTSQAIKEKIESYGYTTVTGDITGVDLTGGTAITIGSETGTASGDYSATISVTDNTIGATQLNVSGNGSTSQFLRSDGDGTFSWAVPSGSGASQLGELSDAVTGPTGDQAQRNVGLGENALDSITQYVSGIVTDGGLYNVAVGYDAGTAVTTGDNNTFVGYQAGAATTTGHSNVAIGQTALDAPDTEDYNIAIGRAALGGAIAGGEKNIAIGYTAGDAITSADGSVLIGHQAGGSITTGLYNVAVGYQALDAITTNGQNVAIGYSALGQCTSGNNVAVGADAGRALTSGNQNVFVGYATGYYATSTANTLVGYGAGDNVTTGGNNTLIGVTAGGAINSGTDNIMLGRNAGDNITSGDNNVIIGGVDADSATADDQLKIASGDGGVTWITGTSNSLTAVQATTFSGGITDAGTIAAGTWNGSVIASAYLDSDTAHLTGTQTFSGSKTFSAKITADAGIDIDNFNIDGTTIALSSGDMTLDSAGDIILDADGADVILKDGGTEYGRFVRATSDFIIKSATNDKDIIFKGIDNSATITALTLDMSEAGAATFGGGIADAGTISAGTWSGSTIAVNKGGTGQTSYTNGQLLIGNTTGNTLTKATLTAGSGISITNGTGSITIAASGGGGGASAIGDLDDVLMDATNFVDGFLLQPESDGSAPTTGTLNSATGNIGLGVDVFNTLTEGDYNVGIGYQASDSLTTGSENVHIGYQAGQANNVGAKNVFVGSGAGYSDSNGILGVAIGYRACYSGGLNYGVAVGGEANYSAGSNVTAVGYRAHKSHTGSFNVAIGREALDASGSGGYNVAIGGRHALGAVTSGARNIGIGYQAADGFDTESDNIAIGYDALGGSVAGGEYNIAIGNYSGDAITSADNSVLVGHKAGTAITTGSSNVAIGYQALDANTTGANIIAIGPNAVGGDGAANSVGIGSQALNVATGEANVAIGHWASKVVSTGYGNISIGYLAGQAITTGEQNVFIGEQAGSVSEADADDNVVIGRYAGVYVSDKNTFVGGSAGTGSASSTGDNNIGLGYNALDDYTTGANNIAIGYQAGDNITTGSNNVIIGGVDAPSATGSDQLVIASGDGSPTWITGDSDGNVSFNHLADVIAVSTNTTLTQAQSGSYVYWTGGTLTLPSGCAAGTQFTIFNNSGSNGTVGLNGGTMNLGWASNAAVADNDATSYVCTGEAAGASYWVQVGA